MQMTAMDKNSHHAQNVVILIIMVLVVLVRLGSSWDICGGYPPRKYVEYVFSQLLRCSDEN